VSVPDALLETYRKTAFNADTPKGCVSLRVGQRCRELDDLLTDHGVSTSAYVTAVNPGSMRLSDKDNAARQRELDGLLRALAQVVLRRGRGQRR